MTSREQIRPSSRAERVAYLAFLCMLALVHAHLQGRWRWTMDAIHVYLAVPEVTLGDILPYFRTYIITALMVAALVFQYDAQRAPWRGRRAAACWLLAGLCSPEDDLSSWVVYGALAWAAGAWAVRGLVRNHKENAS